MEYLVFNSLLASQTTSAFIYHANRKGGKNVTTLPRGAVGVDLLRIELKRQLLLVVVAVKP